jgi:hypothetical protein
MIDIQLNTVNTLHILKQILTYFNNDDRDNRTLILDYRDNCFIYERENNLKIHKLILKNNLFIYIKNENFKQFYIPITFLLQEIKSFKKIKKDLTTINLINKFVNKKIMFNIKTRTEITGTDVVLPITIENSNDICNIQYDYTKKVLFEFSIQIEKLSTLINSNTLLNKDCEIYIYKDHLELRLKCQHDIIKTYDTVEYKNENEFILSFDSSIIKNIVKVFSKKEFLNFIFSTNNILYLEINFSNSAIIVFKTQYEKNPITEINNKDIESLKKFNLMSL